MNGKSRFVWHDLNTTDVAAAQRFYGELFNWRFDTTQPEYVHIKNGEQVIAGLRLTHPGEPQPYWLGYASVDDVAAAATAVTSNGGKVIVPAKTIEAGTFSIVLDPTGAVLSLWKTARPEENVEPTGRAGTHNFCWDELLSTDVDKAVAFYTKVFGWKVEKVDMGPGGVYNLLKRPGFTDENGRTKDAGGVWKSPAPASFWTTYVAVENCDATLAKAVRMGGKEMMPAMDVPNVGRFAAISDPQGAGFAILQPKS